MSMYYSRSLSERIKIKLEIYYENAIDFLGQNSTRKPLLIMAGLALFVTFRNSRHSITSIKQGYLSPFRSKFSKYNPFSPYGTTASSAYGRSGYPNPYTQNPYGGGGAAAGRGASPYTAAGGAAASSYSRPGATGYPQQPIQQQQQQQQNAYASQPGAPAYNSNLRTAPAYNSNLRGAQSAYSAATPAAAAGANTGFSTSRLVDQYRASVQVVQGGLFHDYGMTTQFMGQIETVDAIESPTYVQQILNSPGKHIL